MIPKEMVSLAAEFAVASELCRRGLYAQLTLGNKKRTDLLVHDEETNNFLRIEVKGKQTREWPGCKGIYGKNVMMVFVDYMNKKESERADFFVLTVEDWRELVTENAKRYPNVLLVNWFAAILHHQNLLWSDNIHPQPIGGRLYAKVVRAVVVSALHERPRLHRPKRQHAPPPSGFLLRSSYATLYS